jgi:hypothetical protein
VEQFAPPHAARETSASARQIAHYCDARATFVQFRLFSRAEMTMLPARLATLTTGAAMSDADLSALTSREFLGHHKKVHSVHWNCVGKYLASGSVDQTARIWNVESHSSVNIFSKKKKKKKQKN